MLFNSFTFIYFFSLIYPLYLVLARRAQNLLLLAASFVFYGWWDWRFLGLLSFSIVADFYFARAIAAQSDARWRKALLTTSIVMSLTILGFFKYFDFFVQELGYRGFDLILPVGISFYTFQTISYVVDVYRRRVAAADDLLDFAVYVSFFPHLVAGPIVRAASLLTQIKAERRVTAAGINEAFWFLLYGYFMKVVVADNLAPLVGALRSDVAGLDASRLLPCFYAITFLIYADFAGYSSIARGLAKLMGIELGANFKLPLFARNPADFWRRWHVSLSDWFRDYVFKPLVKRRHRPTAAYLGLCALLTLVLCGLWHGAAWNFIAFGFLHGLLLVAYYAVRKPLRRVRWPQGPLATLGRLASTVLVFHLLASAAVLFLAKTPADWLFFMQRLLREGGQVAWSADLATLLAFAVPLVAIDLLQEWRRDLHVVPRQALWVRWPIYTVLLALIVLCGATGTHAFVYFQF